jgi:hypothetical protein
MNSLDILGEVTAEAAIDFTRWVAEMRRTDTAHHHGSDQLRRRLQ